MLAETPFPSQLPHLPSRHFCGRDDELHTIRDEFDAQSQRHAQRVVAVHGLGGIGKTQVCLAYAHGNVSRYTAIFWVNASSDQTINESFRQIAQSLVDWAVQLRSNSVNFSRIAFDLGMGSIVSPTTGEVSTSSNHSFKIVKAVKSWLESPQNKDWLLVFDSADDLDRIDLLAYLPQSPHGEILISSRRKESAQLGRGLELGCLQPQHGRDLLIAQAGIEGDGEYAVLPTTGSKC